jgi:hypothetical protein
MAPTSGSLATFRSLTARWDLNALSEKVQNDVGHLAEDGFHRSAGVDHATDGFSLSEIRGEARQLDSLWEQEVMTASNELRGKMTIVIVAHRLSTLQRADIIYVLDNGRIVEHGSWTSLCRDEARFHRLMQAQTVSQQGRSAADAARQKSFG